MPDSFSHLLDSAMILLTTVLLIWNRSTTRKTLIQSRENHTALLSLHRRAPAQVLIVDDDHNDLMLMTRALQSLGAEVIGLLDASGVESLIRSRTSSSSGYPFDIVFTDLRMPHGASEHVMELFKTLAPGVQRCVITGRARYDSIEAMRAWEPYTFLTKPLTVETASELFLQMHIPFKRST